MSACLAKSQLWIAIATLVLFAANAGSADAPAPASTQGFEAFRLVRTRNIFNPDRRANTPDSASKPPPAPSRPDAIALTGTMVTPSKQLAFFTGSRSDFHKVIGVREKIGDCTITGISSTHVDLERGGKALVLAVGKQLALDSSGAITTASAGEATPSSSGPPAPAASAPAPTGGESAPPTSAPSGDKSEVLRRMMERRQKEMSK